MRTEPSGSNGIEEGIEGQMASSERAYVYTAEDDREQTIRIDYRLSDSYQAYRMAVAREMQREQAHEPAHRVKRSRERPARRTEPDVPQRRPATPYSVPQPVPKAKPHAQPAPGQTLLVSELRQIIVAAVCIAVLLIGLLILNAYAVNVQCNINALTKSNRALQDEIDQLNMQIDGSTSISQVEAYAMDKLNMHYPTNGQNIYISEDAKLPENFAYQLKKRAYADESGKKSDDAGASQSKNKKK